MTNYAEFWSAVAGGAVTMALGLGLLSGALTNGMATNAKNGDLEETSPRNAVWLVMISWLVTGLTFIGSLYCLAFEKAVNSVEWLPNTTAKAAIFALAAVLTLTGSAMCLEMNLQVQEKVRALLKRNGRKKNRKKSSRR